MPGSGECWGHGPEYKRPPDGFPNGGLKPLRNADYAFTLSFSALAMVTLTCLSAGFVIVAPVAGLRT